MPIFVCVTESLTISARKKYNVPVVPKKRLMLPQKKKSIPASVPNKLEMLNTHTNQSVNVVSREVHVGFQWVGKPYYEDT